MKILSIGNFAIAWDNSICDEEHIAGALEELGHEVKRHQRDSSDVKDLWIYGSSWNPDFILIAQWDRYPIELISMLKDIYHNCPLVYWAFDYQADGQEWHERLVKEADLYLSKRIADSKYLNWQWLSQDFAPKFLDRWNPFKYGFTPQKDIDVLFTGSYLPWATERNETLKAVDEKFNLVIHSVNEWPGFKDVRPPIMDEGLPELYARAKVILSIDHTIEAGYWSDRCAQAMCCGAFVLHRYQPLSSSIFHSYIGYFYDIPTCLQSLEYWLEADEDRENLAAFGYEYAQQNMKVRNRVEDFLNIVDSGLELVPDENSLI
jgi:hypothetical protein